jgi:dihydrofolate reductase
MQKTILNITMSLDGFVAGPNISQENPLGQGGPALHRWMFENMADADKNLQDEFVANTGAVILGNTTYATAIKDAWGGKSPFDAHAFVLASQAPEEMVSGFTFIQDGIHSAWSQAKQKAGVKNIWVMGGANVVQQFLNAGIIDEMMIRIAPIFLGRGARLFDEVDTGLYSVDIMTTGRSPLAVYISYRLVKK